MNSKSIWKKVVCIALAFCFCAGLLPGDFTFNHLAYAEDVLTVPQPESDSADEGGWLYRICDDGFAEVTGYSDNTVSALTIPSSLGGAWVVRIAPNAFADNVALETISIPATVAEINASAFPNHTNLTVRAANGTMALRFAAQRNFDAVNTSKYDFFDDMHGISM